MTRKSPAPVLQQGPDRSRRAWPIFALGVLLSLALAAFFVHQGIRDYRIFNAYQPAQCTVTGFGVLTSTMTAGTGRTRSPRTTFTSQYVFEHDAGGKRVTSIGFDNMGGIMGDKERFTVGQTYPCWYDPDDPEDAVLARHFYPEFYAGSLIPLVLLLVSGSFLMGALRSRPAITLADGGPGEVLAVRLAPDLSRSATLVSFVVLFVAFSAALLGAFVWIAQDWSRLGDVWLFLALAVAAEAWLIRYTLSAAKAMKIPDPIVEIDHEPVARGDKLKISVIQHGPARFDVFRVAIACEQQGKGGRKRESHKVLTMKKDFDVDDRAPFVDLLDAAIAADASVSDKSLETLTTWRIVVKRSKKGSWGLEREYVFRVV
jgi:hypothetical protein